MGFIVKLYAMKTNNKNGQLITIIIAIFIVAKTILNTILSGSLDIKGGLLEMIVAALLVMGLQYTNYAAAIVIGAVALAAFPANCKNLPGSLIYLLEGITDIGIAVILCIIPAVKEHCSNAWNDIGSIFKT